MSDNHRKEPKMPTYYAEDYDGKKNDDAVEPVTLAPVSDFADSKRVEPDSVEDKAVKAPAKKTAKKTAKKK